MQINQKVGDLQVREQTRVRLKEAPSRRGRRFVDVLPRPWTSDQEEHDPAGQPGGKIAARRSAGRGHREHHHVHAPPESPTARLGLPETQSRRGSDSRQAGDHRDHGAQGCQVDRVPSARRALSLGRRGCARNEVSSFGADGGSQERPMGVTEAERGLLSLRVTPAACGSLRSP